ncbi:MAG: ABC transporter ATP-binding protein [Gammaproteobacteria bacterium]|nr:MAG: ABC transporter ATP-binding protein [Gammaproteobacteria bacterium]
MLKIKNIQYSYGNIKALHNISLQVKKGELVALVGSNGAGKSTILSCISGIRKIKNGSIKYNNQEISGLSPTKIVNLKISQIPEGRLVFAPLSVEDNLNLGAFSIKKNKQQKQKMLDDIYQIFPILYDKKQQSAGMLSGGQQQMLAIGRALMSEPELLLLDEPSMGLAPLLVQEIFKIIRQLNLQGVSMLLVEQNAKAALDISSYAYVIENGEVATCGKSKEIINDEKIKKAYLGY